MLKIFSSSASTRPRHKEINEQHSLKPRFLFVGAACLLLSIVISLFGLVAPLYSMEIFDRVLPTASMPTLVAITVAAFCAVAVSVLVDGVRSSLLSRCAGRIGLAYSAPLLRVKNDEASRTRLHDIDTVRSFVAGPIICSVFDLPASVTSFVASFWINTLFGWIILISAMLLMAAGFGGYLATRSARIAGRSVGAEERSLSQILSRDARSGAAMGVEFLLAERAQQLHRYALRHLRLVQDRSGWIEAFSRGLRAAVQIATVAMAAVLVIRQTIEPGSIVAMSMLTSRILSPVERVAASVGSLVNLSASVKRLHRSGSGSTSDITGQSLATCNGSFALEEVAITVDELAGCRVLVESMSVRLGQGEVLVAGGATGSGKTLLCQLFTGLRVPSRGSVTLDGYNLRTLNPAFLRRNIGYLCENNDLGPGSVEEIISRRGTIKHDDVVLAAKLAGIHDTILKLRHGYKTAVNDNTGLSAGELRKIAIARAFYQFPMLIVLDNPTLHLDSDGEEHLANSLQFIKSKSSSAILIITKSELIKHIASVYVFMRGSSSPVLLRPRSLSAKASLPQRTLA